MLIYCMLNYKSVRYSLSSSLEDKKFFLKKGKVVSLKRSHPYFYQIRSQMYCTGLKRIDLVVWFGSYEPLFIQSVPYDDSFMDRCVLQKLKFFYCRAILPEFFYTTTGVFIKTPSLGELLTKA